MMVDTLDAKKRKKVNKTVSHYMLILGRMVMIEVTILTIWTVSFQAFG